MPSQILYRLPVILYLFAFALLSFTSGVQSPSKAAKQSSSKIEHDEAWVRDVDPNAPCKFAPVFQRISENKRDPRVAFVELSQFVHVENPLKFEDLCEMISDQTEDTNAVFDRTRGFLQIIWAAAVMNEALAYFEGSSRDSGVFLYTQSEGPHSFVFAYRNQEWHDVTKEYLGPFNLSEKDYIVAPQYGRTARVLTSDTNDVFHQKLWLHWSGTKFEAQTVRPKDWRCPDSYRYFPAQERRQYCQ